MSGWQHVAPEPVCTFQHKWSLHRWDHEHQHTFRPAQGLAVELCAGTIWMVLFLFSPEDTTSLMSRNSPQFGLIGPQHTFPLCSSSSQMSSGPENFLDVVISGFNLVFNAGLPEGSKVTGIQCWLSALPLTCRGRYYGLQMM